MVDIASTFYVLVGAIATQTAKITISFGIVNKIYYICEIDKI